ncbi:hypothetical protein BGW38_002148 [Lunasporangiospora selenospora]|uniref:Protein kinase domain-containing protein n=1 Tax=Lunasporangiospora selenospora TaxID=979761 RepID=A0A9P6KH95_9FUNG|nr:hypothetical protein BGW38_002148 [Lunasporangiospora selenospora]
MPATLRLYFAPSDREKGGGRQATLVPPQAVLPGPPSSQAVDPEVNSDKPSGSPSPPATTHESISGFKIRIPRNLPNLPEAFKQRGAIRTFSTSSSSPESPPSLSDMTPLPSETAKARSRIAMGPRSSSAESKRPHSDMVLNEVPDATIQTNTEDAAAAGKKPRVVKSEPTSAPSTPAISSSTRLAIRTTTPTSNVEVGRKRTLDPELSDYEPRSSAIAAETTLSGPRRTENAVSSSVTSKRADLQLPLTFGHKRHRSKTKSKTRSPSPTRSGFPTPTSMGGAGGDSEDTSPPPPVPQLPKHTLVASAPGGVMEHQARAVSKSDNALESSAANVPQLPEIPVVDFSTKSESNPSFVAPSRLPPLAKGSNATAYQAQRSLELVQAGITIINRLMCQPVCQIFVNKVPSSVKNYYNEIKEPMDLSTMEAKLWKTLEYSNGPIHMSVVVGSTHVSVNKGYKNFDELVADLDRIYLNAVAFNPVGSMVNKDAQSYRSIYQNILTAYYDNTLVLELSLPQQVFMPSIISLTEPGPLYFFRGYLVREMEKKMTDVSVELFSTLHRSLYSALSETGNLSLERPRFVRMFINKNRSLLSSCRDEPNAKIAILICVKADEVEFDVPSRFDKGTLTKVKHEVIPFSGSNKLSMEQKQAIARVLGVKISDTNVAPKPGWVGSNSSSYNSTPSKLQSSNETNVSLGSSPVSSMVVAPETLQSSESMPTLPKPRSEVQVEILSRSWPRPRAEQKPERSINTVTGPIVPSPVTPTQALDRVELTTPSLNQPASQSQSLISTSDAQREGVPLTNPSRAISISSTASIHSGSSMPRVLTQREKEMLWELKLAAQRHYVPYTDWNTIEPTLIVDTAQGLFKRIYHIEGQNELVVQSFKEMDSESFEQRVREVACLLKLRGLEGVGQIQSVIDDENDQLVGLSMTKYEYTLKAYATNARRHPSPSQKLSIVCDMIDAICDIHNAGLAHRDLSEVNIMVDEDSRMLLEDNTPRPRVRVIDFGKSVFLEREEFKRWSIQDNVPKGDLDLLPLIILPPDHGYKLYSGQSPWAGTIEDDIKSIRYQVSSDSQIRFQLEREVVGTVSRELLLKCLTAEAATRWTAQQLKEWIHQPGILCALLKEFEELGAGRKKMRKNLD